VLLQPRAPLVPPQVTGIFFESKVDYTTWFGADTHLIHGIQVNKSTEVQGCIIFTA